MKISIALCTYNGDRYLQEQLDSYCNQELRPDELVVCDDSSNDSTRTILSSFANNAPFNVTLVFNDKNIGLVRNFESAISRCRGDIICLSDQDDVWFANKLTRIADAFESSDEIGMVYSDALVVDEQLKPTGTTMWKQINFSQKKQGDFQNGRALDWLLKDGHVLGMSMAFRSKFVEQIIPFPQDIYFIHDNWIALVVSCLSEVKIIDSPLVHYRQHAGQSSSGMEPYDAPKFERMLQEARRINGYDQIIRQMDILLHRIRDNSKQSDEVIGKISAAMTHFQMRANLDGKFLRRIHQIRREITSTRYHRFSNGMRSALKDVFTWKEQT